MAIENNFWAKVNNHGAHPHNKATVTTRCHEWTGSVKETGYGQFWDGAQLVKAHRYAYILHYGKGSLGSLYCLHKCDNPRCVRWSHLFKGTQKRNLTDMAHKGRSTKGRGIDTSPLNPARGESNGSAKLTEQKVLKIRRLYAKGILTQVGLSEKFAVTRKTIVKVLHRKT